MNSLPDTLNVWADHALRFAWPMLWQSSLLIGLLFALDLVLRRKLRPAVRYALWLVVLVKLLLPPSLAFPTGPGWWLRQAKAAPARPLPTTPVVVTYDFPATPMPSVAAAPVFIAPPPPPPPPRLTPASWTLVGMIAVSLGLLAWMLVRWYQVAREARRAAAAPAWLSELLPKRRHSARLRLIDSPLSPAVCGLFRPVILLPRLLAEHLAPAQLRAVLLHELHHLRRGDVWVNCAQALVQILYWWHPLLWFANARIRRVREEAVDDAVMLALKEEADTYAPTLLEVAKLALQRPLATLGLVGILESRSSLRQRIERLVDFRPPRKAGLTVGSALAVLGFAALAVPMGEAPATNGVPQVSESQVVTNASASDDSSNSGLAVEEETESSTLVRDGKLLYQMGKLDGAEAKLTQAQPHDAAVKEAVYRQANLIGLRQRLADARAAEDRYALASAAKLYDDAWEYAQKIGSGVDTERDQTIAGLAAVRLELARAAQHRGDYKEARMQV
ncbi:MAG: M56 family metallopeptidase, partial [Verrucomicrobia bacterium]|nr:M56 family metallopeptidase [Verrucomicrobiota bacterium]